MLKRYLIAHASSDADGYHASKTPATGSGSELQACLAALAIFSTIVDEALYVEDLCMPSHGHLRS